MDRKRTTFLATGFLLGFGPMEKCHFLTFLADLIEENGEVLAENV